MSAELVGEQDLRVVLLGKVGVGTSESGNTLLGSSCFLSDLSASAVTQCCEAQTMTLGGRRIMVVDTPGLAATMDSNTAKEKLRQCLQLSAPGPHVFLLVIRLGRFTQEERDIVERVTEVFGEMLYMFTIILFTSKETTASVREYISSAGPGLQQLVEKCGSRYHAFNIENPDEEDQVGQLIVKIDTLVAANGGRWYTSTDNKMEDVEIRLTDTPSQGEQDLRVVLLGKVGVGKSESGNTLLGSSCFLSDLSASAVTQCCEAQTVTLGGRRIMVVDTPGLAATMDSNTAKENLCQCLQLSAPGPHVFLLVIRLGRFTQEERDIVERVTEVFGETLYMFTIILFTSKETTALVREYISSAEPGLQQLVEKCGSRYHAFNIENPDEEDQVGQLIVKIDTLVAANGGRWYTSTDNKMEDVEIRLTDTPSQENSIAPGQPIPITSEQREVENQSEVNPTETGEREQPPSNDKQENTTTAGLNDPEIFYDFPSDGAIPCMPHNPILSNEEFKDASQQIPDEYKIKGEVLKGHPPPQEYSSGPVSMDENLICVEFHAVLKREFEIKNNKLQLVTNTGKKFQLELKPYDVDWMFTLVLHLRREEADFLHYKYCLTVDGKDGFETLAVENSEYMYRRLHRTTSESDKVFYQFDDVCLQEEVYSWSRFKWTAISTEIDEIREEFIQTTLIYLMSCISEDFSEMQNKVSFFIRCVQNRQVDSESVKLRSNSKKSIQSQFNSALEQEIKSLMDSVPVQKVLAAAVLAQELSIKLERPSIEKLSEIVRQNGKLAGALTGLDDSVRRVLFSAVGHVFHSACDVQSARGAMWMMALFYAVAPAEQDQVLTFDPKDIQWEKAQSDWAEIVRTHADEIKKHEAFAKSLLDMFSIGRGDPELLSNLDTTAHQFLKQLLEWVKRFKFHELHKVISVVTLKIKQWLEKRCCLESLPMDIVKEDLHSCMVSTVHIIEESLKKDSDWTKHCENVYSSNQLLNSYTGHLDLWGKREDLMIYDNVLHIMGKMSECIKNTWKSGIEEWTRLFSLPLPKVWQTHWERILKSLFMEKLRKEKIDKQVKLYCENSSVCPAMDECMLQCAIEAVKLYCTKKGQSTMSDLLKIMLNFPKSGKLMSYLVENKLESQQYIYLLYDEQLKDIFRVLEELRLTHKDYMSSLSAKAKDLIQRAYTQMEILIEEIMNKSISCDLMKDIIVRKHNANDHLLGKNKPRFLSVLKEADKVFYSFEERKSKIRALYNLNRDMPVDIELLDSALQVDLSRKERSLKSIMEMLSKEPGSKSGSDTYFINIQMFGKIDVLSESTHFKERWREKTRHVKNTDFENVRLIPLDQVQRRIFQPTFVEYRKSYEALKDLSISLNDLEITFGKFIRNGMWQELKTMATVFSDDTKMENTYTHTKRYRELQSVEENANVINKLKDHLCLHGDFVGLDDLRHMEHKCLGDLTEEVCSVGETVKNIPTHVISFLKEFDTCVTKGFISWVKEIIKDTGELTVFVELASISAGENAMDLDKVCCFRDAISACTPLIYQLPENSGLHALLRAITELKPALESDAKLVDKLRDSCNNRDWLEIAYETHGSVERSSLRQATDINESGIYIIKRPAGAQSKVTLENCITLRCRESSSDGNEAEFRTYSLAELKELQNKLMLITASADKREDEITTYVKVLEQVINVGKLFLELREAGHILFQDWEMSAYCQRGHDVKIWVKFDIANVEIKGHRPLLEELKGLCESMSGCLSEWLKYMDQKRNTYYMLNHFTAKQLVYLCRSVAAIQTEETVSPRLLNMLSIMMGNIEETDVSSALSKALHTPLESGGSQASRELTKFLNDYPDMIEYFLESGFTEEEIKAAIMFCEEEKQTSGELEELEVTEEFRDRVMECIDRYEDDEEWVQEWCEKYEKTRDDVLQSQMKFKGGQAADEQSFTMTEEQIAAAFENLENSDEKIVMLWKTYHNRLSGLVSDKFVDLDVLGEMMNHLARSAEVTVRRTLLHRLEKGRPNLISCKDAEIFPLCLSLYSDNDQPLPSYYEILICTPDTTAEQVELIIRRAVQPGSPHDKIYSLLNADKLNHDVSRKLESIFYKLSKNQGDTGSHDYHLIIFCDSMARHSYVATAFDIFKRTIAENPNRNNQVKQYLREKHQTSSKAETGFTKLHSSELFQLRTKLVFSVQAGMGKSLYVKNLVKVSEEKLKSEGFTHTTIRITESQLRTEDIISRLQQYEDKPMDKVPRIFHFDVPPVVTKGLYTFLLQLFVLRCFQNPDGFIWRCNDSHIYLVEYTKRKHRECGRHSSEMSSQIEDTFLEMFPAVKCLSPEETQKHVQGGPCDREHQLMDGSEFGSEAFQRTYQYFKRYRENKLESFSFKPGSTEDSPKECLECVLQFCDIKNPSWGELRNFTHFLSSQLKKSEESIFCSDALKDDLTGFKKFVVKFMITMSKDFSMRSLRTSDDKEAEVAEEDIALKEFQLRRRWEQQAHPYILFNADHDSMTFLGFHIHHLHAFDIRTHTIVEENIIDRTLFAQLRAQKVPFNVDFEGLNRLEKLDIISRVLGVKSVEDPDETYQLTLDNVMKMFAIHLRFESDIPVIIMGETGCGKTRLVQFMCDLMRSGRQRQNLIVVRVHGGTTSEVIYNKVRGAIKISKENEAHKLDTVLFFDEANTTEAVNAIKEVICDKSVNGEQIDAPCLKVIAACNPYRKHTQKAIEQLERAGLGYRVRCENTEEKLGQIPMRQLVYRVQPLPPSLTPLVWDFGKLNEHTQALYINQMVRTFFSKENLPGVHRPLFTKVISASQKHMAGLKDECRMVSLRDIERCMKTVMWFYHQKETLFPEIDKIRGNKGNVDDLVRSLVLAVGVCYLASLDNRGAYLKRVSEFFPSDIDVHTEIELCKKAFISNVDCPPSVAKNDALKENVFMMVVCMNLRIPLFLVGKPGSSKSLSKTFAAHAMQGKASQNDLFKSYKQAQLASFQCSPHSSPDGIISIFRQCAQFQKDKNLDEYVAVVVLDEIGLAEDSPKMPLKTLHPLLEYGCVDDENPDDFKKVAFIGISNWSLDPAKMNRGILVLRTSPLTDELQNTACDICSSDKENINTEMECLIPMLTKFYLNVLKEQSSEFFGLRDFYSLVKLILSYATDTNGRPSDEDLTKAVQRNFEGLDSINVLEIFWDVLKQRTEKCDTISLLKENLDMGASGFTSRYLLLPTVNHAALYILKSQKIIDESNTEIIFGSGFPRDEEYSQVCRTVNRVKTCMETGRPVVLLNIQSLYESLYDALNQCYVKLGGSYYVDLGLGSHRVKCRVKEEFRLIVIEEKSTVYEQFPTPLLNRLEKHCLEISTILPEHAKRMQAQLENWLDSFVAEISNYIYLSEERSKEQSRISKKKFDTIVGYTEDTCASVLLQCCPEIVSQEPDQDRKQEALEMAKETLLQCATPDAVLRATKYMENPEKFLEVYFKMQPHGNLIEMVKTHRQTRPAGISLEVSTYHRLLNKRDVEQICKELNINEEQSRLFLLDEFYTEQSFSQTIREFLCDDVMGHKLLLLQTYFDDPKKSQRLLFCVRHCISQLRSLINAGVDFDVVLLIRMPRISGGCGYISSFGDDWISVHLDELIPTPGFLRDIYELQRLSVSEILKKSFSGEDTFTEDQDSGSRETTLPEEQVLLVDTLFLLKKSLQKGILQLHDKADNTQRATKRIEILHGLLHKKYPAVSDTFIKFLEGRIISLLSTREKMEKKEGEKRENWVITQALSEHFVAEGGSFRHMLWVYLEDTVASALAQILAVIDGDNNLDNLIEQPSEKSDLWLNVFREDELNLLKIPVSEFQGKVSVVSTSGQKDKSRTCRFPFSWVLKERFEQIWSNVINMKVPLGPSIQPNREYLETYEEFITWTWIKSIKKDQELFAMFCEDLVNISMPAYPYELNKSFSDTLLRLTSRLYHDLTADEPDNVSLPWLYVASEYMHDNHQLFYNLFLQNKDLVTEGEATQALKQALKCLQPKDSLLKDFASCQQWLQRVKSLSMTVDLILSEDSLVTRHAENAAELTAEIRLHWQSTWIVFLLMDHLLQNELEMEKKLLTILVRNLTFAWKKLNTKAGNQMEYLVEQVTGTLNKCSKNACNVFKVLCGYCDKEFTEDDTAELQCGHMFHITCLKAHNDTQCRKCKKDINQDYKPCGVVDKDTFLKVNRFRRKCSSFFVEFMWNFVSSKEQLTDKVVDMLMDYMKGCQLTKVPKQCSLQLYMNPDPVVQSLVLRVLLKCGMEETAPQLQRFIEEAVKPNERNADELYFMVVRSIEDHIHSSNQGCLSKKAKECLDTCLFINSDEAVISEDLHTIAKLRFAISVASDTIRTALSEEFAVDYRGNEPLLRSLQQLISNTGNPWIQIFLLRNLCNMHGFSIIHRLTRNERFQWTIPSEVFEEQDKTTEQVDQFLMHGEMYEGITGDAVKALTEPSYYFAQKSLSGVCKRTLVLVCTFLKRDYKLSSFLTYSPPDLPHTFNMAFDQTSARFPVCMALAAVRQATLNPSTRYNKGSLMSKMKMRASIDGSWSEVVQICKNMLGNHLAEVDPGLSNTGDLSQIVFHTALVAKLSAAPEMELIKTLCFNPANAKDCFFPTMPSSINEIEHWSMDPDDKVKIWVCSCGEPVLIGNCGRPYVKGKCLNCQNEIGGEHHYPVDGFKAFENRESNGKGHNLGDPNTQREQNGERNLYGANLSLVRAIIHSSMLWGTIEHAEEVKNIIQTPHDDVRRYLCGHLQKDIELLAKAIGKSTEDAQMAVHLFLRCMLEGGSEPNTSIQMTDTEQKREEWEDTVHKRLKVFFQNFDEELLSVQNSILQSGGMNTMARIIYSREPQLKELPATGVFNRPLMWRFEQRMTIQHLTHLIEQDDERKNVPVLSELLKNHFHIKYIRYLPQVLRLQQKLMCSFENVDPQCYMDVPISTFMKENVPDDDGQAFTKDVLAVKEIWGHLKKINYPKLPQDLKHKDENDLMILDLLPREKSVARTVTDYLVRMQNDFINLVNPKADRLISASEVKPSHVINCVPEQDFLTIAISNIDHVVYEDGKESTNYNFKAVERQLADRFFMEKPMIKLTTLPLFEYNTGTTLRAFFSTVEDKLIPLNTNDRNCIMNDFRFLNEISAALSTLKIAIGFMKLSFPEPEQFLLTYLKKDLKLEDRAHTLSLPVLRASRVKHIQSLWEVLSLRQSALLIEMNQNPFFMIEDHFHEVFTEERRNEKMSILVGLTNIDILITELHYVIMNIKLKEVSPAWTIEETFEAFLVFSEIDEKAMECLEKLQDVKMSHGIALWKLAVQIKKGIKATGSK